MTKKAGRRFSVYIKSIEEYNFLRNEVQTLWYRLYGEYLSNSDVLIKALTHLREELESGSDKMGKRRTREIMSKYNRISK